MVATQAQLIARLTTTLAERLWSMSRQLQNTQIPDPLHKLFDMLALQLEKERVQCSAGVSYNFDLTPTDLANMCGIPQEQQPGCLHQFMTDSRIRLENNKITIPDCLEIVKSADFYRKQVR